MQRAAAALVVAAVLVIAACGGGDGGSETTVPASVAASRVGTEPPLVGSVLRFTQDVADPDRRLQYRWEFGDGATSSEAQPSHTYAKADRYRITLTVSDASGRSIQTQLALTVADSALSAGLLCTKPEGQGWCWQHPRPQGNPIESIFHAGPRTAYAAGASGTLLATRDGGTTWSKLDIGTQVSLNAVLFTSENNGLASGPDGVVFRTRDAGRTWQARAVASPAFAARFTRLDDGSVLYGPTNFFGAVISTDEGTSWTSVPGFNSPVNCPNGPTLASATEVWCHTFGSPPVLAYSSDAAATFTNVQLPALQAGWERQLPASAFRAGGVGAVIALDSRLDNTTFTRSYVKRLFVTVDAGRNWTSHVVDNDGFYTSGLAMAGADRVLVWCGNSLPQCAPRLTRDRGATWVPLALPADVSANTNLVTFRFEGPGLIVARDNLGHEYSSADNGATWLSYRVGQDPALPALTGVRFLDRRVGVATTSLGSILRTTDGGRTWTASALAPLSSLDRLGFTRDGSLGWARAAGSRLVRTLDGGQTWTETLGAFGASQPQFIADVHFADRQRGWLLGAANPFGGQPYALYSTVNGGTVWTRSPLVLDRVPQVLAFSEDGRRGVILGDSGQAWVSEDGGLTWTDRFTAAGATFSQLRYVGGTTFVALSLDGRVVSSSDGGHTWVERVPSSYTNRLNDLFVLDARRWWVVGEAGTVLATEDGGISWRRVSSGTTRALAGVHFIDSLTGWIVGESQTVLVTTTGAD